MYIYYIVSSILRIHDRQTLQEIIKIIAKGKGGHFVNRLPNLNYYVITEKN